jgi:hypothetical protein
MEVAAAEATMRLNASCATYRAAPIEPLLRLKFSAETPGPTDFAKIVKADVAVLVAHRWDFHCGCSR